MVQEMGNHLTRQVCIVLSLIIQAPDGLYELQGIIPYGCLGLDHPLPSFGFEKIDHYEEKKGKPKCPSEALIPQDILQC